MAWNSRPRSIRGLGGATSGAVDPLGTLSQGFTNLREARHRCEFDRPWLRFNEWLHKQWRVFRSRFLGNPAERCLIQCSAWPR